MPKTGEVYDLAFLKKVVEAWNAGDPKRVVAGRWGHSPGWLDNRLSEAKALGLHVLRRQKVGTVTAYSEQDLEELARRFRADERNYHIAAAMGKTESWVSRGRDRLLCNGVDLTAPVQVQSIPLATQNPARKVSIRLLAGVAISLPYLRCLDPEAARA